MQTSAVVPYSLDRTLGPVSEPVTIAEARDQVEISAGDTTHDVKLTRYIEAAREQVETDTGYALLTQTFTLSLTVFPCEPFIPIPIRPIQSITSVKYYDTGDDQQTLSTDVYGTDSARRGIYVKNDQEWPSVNEQHNGIVITIVAGYGLASNVPRILKQAVLLQVTKWFAHRGDESQMVAHDTAYQRIVRRIMRTSYP